MTKDIIVVDLDGTLADCSHRVHLAQEKRWGEFHSGLERDEVHAHIRELVIAMVKGNFIAIAVTGRSEHWRHQTWEWLHKREMINCFDKLIMRPEGNFDPDHKLKLELIEPFKSRILFALDDRSKVVAAFRNAGIPTLQVTDGDY